MAGFGNAIDNWALPMKAHTRSPAEIFGYHLRYVVPLFQRPYVWNEHDQWEPLWNDVRTVADQVLESPPQPFAVPSVSPHFLGAIVVENQPGVVGYVAVWNVVDGQQRLTTLQLLIDAAQEVVEQHGADVDAQALRVLVLNDATITQHDDERFKVWPTDRDQDAFRAAMDNAAVVSDELRTARIVQAHAFFAGKVRQWAGVGVADATEASRRLHALVATLRDYLKLVVIDLEPGDNAQVIFETLNHRGTPLLAADLIKNLVFQLAQHQSCDVAGLYAQHWKPLDSDYWREKVTQGRLFRPRIDVFLNYWLTMKLLREVPQDRVFAEFRDAITRDASPVDPVIKEVARDAGVFATVEALPPQSPEGRFHYRVIQALDTGAVTPVLLWLLRPSPAELPPEQRARALAAIESWIVRRMLARLTSKNVNQVFFELLRALARSGGATAGEVTEQFLASQTADSRLWPDDNLVRATVAESRIFTALVRPRLRMILESLEDDLRQKGLGEGQPCPRSLTVEHVMPRGWRTHWGGDELDPAAALHRDSVVQRLGNLTLVTGKHNSALSNRPWRNDNSTGKRDYLLEHSELKLNAAIVSKHPTTWTEEDIAARTAALTDRILAIWPRPEYAGRTTVDPASVEYEMPVEADDGADSHDGRYRPLWEWLRATAADEVRVSFVDVEQILGFGLPPSSRVHLAHWYGYQGSAVARAIHDAGWRAVNIDLLDEQVTFVRNET